MNDVSRPYEKPEIDYWSVFELDEIEATMSGGGGGGGPVRNYSTSAKDSVVVNEPIISYKKYQKASVLSVKCDTFTSENNPSWVIYDICVGLSNVCRNAADQSEPVNALSTGIIGVELVSASTQEVSLCPSASVSGCSSNPPVANESPLKDPLLAAAKNVFELAVSVIAKSFLFDLALTAIDIATGLIESFSSLSDSPKRLERTWDYGLYRHSETYHFLRFYVEGPADASFNVEVFGLQFSTERDITFPTVSVSVEGREGYLRSLSDASFFPPVLLQAHDSPSSVFTLEEPTILDVENAIDAYIFQFSQIEKLTEELDRNANTSQVDAASIRTKISALINLKNQCLQIHENDTDSLIAILVGLKTITSTQEK